MGYLHIDAPLPACIPAPCYKRRSYMILKLIRKVSPTDEGSSQHVIAFWGGNTGVVREVNLSGVSIEYINLTGNGADSRQNEDGTERVAQIKLINGRSSVTLQAVPVEDVSDKEVGTYNNCALLEKRLYRISFGRLTHLQQRLFGTILSGLGSGENCSPQ